MIEQYKKEIKEMVKKMKSSERWAKKFPIFYDFIIANKIQEDYLGRYGEKYKQINLVWGINRYFFEQRNITNYKGEYRGILWEVYINSLSLYNLSEKFELENIPNQTSVFFYDSANSTFYCKDEEIEGLLECLNDWYLKARELANKRFKEEEIKKLELALAKAKQGLKDDSNM